MESIDQIIDEWKILLDEPINKSLTLSNLTNKSIMDTFINYETKITASKKQSLNVLVAVGSVFITALIIFSLLTYFRGSEHVSYNIAEMVLGTFLSLTGIVAMISNIMKIKFPDIYVKPTVEYLTALKQNLIAWRNREKPVLLAFILLIPTGIALLIKSVFLIPFHYIFIPFFLLYATAVIIGFARNDPEFKAVLKEIDELLLDLKSA